MTSRRMTSGSSASAIWRALGPLYAERTSKYSLDSLASSSFTLASTSSTTNTRPDISVSQLLAGPGALSGKEAFDGSQKTRNRDRFGNIVLAAAVSHLLLISLHRKRGHGDDRNCTQVVVLLDPLS